MSTDAASTASPVKDVKEDTKSPAKEAEPEKAKMEDKPADPNTLKSPEKKEDKESVSAALVNLASGKRNLLVGDVSAAVASLADACRGLGAVYGETGMECGEAYFYYGKALLELARMETGVIQNGMDGDESSENSEEEEEENKEEGADAAKEDAEGDDAEKAEGEADGDEEEEEGGEEKENESIASNDEGTSNAKESTDKSALDAEEEEDPSNLQLSWEMLELAKHCFQRHADSLPAEDAKRMELEDKLSETYQVLGEISIENESYEQAIDDLTSCLRRRQELMPEDSRMIAETHYQMGVAYGFGLKFDEAVASLNDAIQVLTKRIDNLKNKTESVDPMKKNDAFCAREKEIAEIESLLPEIHEKIADTKDMAKESVKRVGDRVLMGEGELESSSSLGGPEGDNGKVAKAIPIKGKSSAGNGLKNGSNGEPASDITHMLKKRKQPEEASAENGSSETKKPHLEEAPKEDAPAAAPAVEANGNGAN